MTVLKKELIDSIKEIPDNKLLVIKPLINMLLNDTLYIEKIPFEELTEVEKASILQTDKEYSNGETVPHDSIDWNWSICVDLIVIMYVLDINIIYYDALIKFTFIKIYLTRCIYSGLNSF